MRKVALQKAVKEKKRSDEKNNWRVNMQVRINNLRADISKVNQITALQFLVTITKNEKERERDEK